ncbi:MAG: response regulator [Sedimenticola sp.]
MSSDNQAEYLSIILAEDDEGHAKLTQKNLRRAGISNNIKWCENGKIALDYIQGEGEYEGNSHTTDVLLLLDLNMPVLDGYRVLEQLKKNKLTKRIPIIILTTTDDAREIKRCYELGCNIYITKPVEYELFSKAIRELGLFLGVIKIPDGA